MKKLLNIFCVTALICAFSASCDYIGLNRGDGQKEQDKYYDEDPDVYYVAGYEALGVDIQDDGTAKSIGYVLISGNLQDTVYVSNRANQYGIGNLFDDIFEFPDTIMPSNVCGPNFFPKEFRYSYKMKITSSRLMTDDEIERATLYICDTFIASSFIRPEKYIVVETLTKLE